MTTARRTRRALSVGEVTDALLGVVALVPSTLLYNKFFGTWSYLSTFALTVVGATVAAVAGVVFRWPRAVRIAVACVGLVAVIVPTALSGTLHGALPTKDTATELGLGLISGWAKMLSVSLPATASGQVLVFFILMNWIAAHTVVATAIVRRSPAAPVVPPVLAYAVGLVMVATPVGTYMGVTALLVTVALVQIMLRARRVTVRAGQTTAHESVKPARNRWYPIVGGIALTLIPLAAGVAATRTGLFGEGVHRADPRPLQPNPSLVPDILTPLATVKPQLRADPPKQVLTATFPAGATVPPAVAVAALDRFDGFTWTTDDEFLTAGQRLAGGRLHQNPTTVTARITIADLPSQFVPVLGWPNQLTFTANSPASVGFSATSGSLITDKPLRPGTVYELTGQFHSATELTSTAEPTAISDDDPYWRLPPDMPAYLDTLPQQITGTIPDAVGKLAAVNSFLRNLPYNLDAPPGHSYADINRVVAATQTREDGHAEQHAAAFAVMARKLGYQSRVVVGYRLHHTGNGTFVVTSKDATAWAEVHFEKYGWIAYDPTDVHQTKRTPPAPASASTSTPTRVPADTAPTSKSDTVTPEPVSPPRSVSWVVVALAVALSTVCLIGLWVLSILARKAVRRQRRRRAQNNAAQVAGAWEESVDRLAELGLPVKLSMTPLEFSRHADSRFGERTAALSMLAEQATTAVFGPEHINTDDAARAWQLERRLRRDLYPGWRRLRSLRTWLSPRPLTIRRSKPTRRPRGRQP